MSTKKQTVTDSGNVPSVEDDNGLLIDRSSNHPTCLGYIFDFTGHGAFSPSGKVKLNGRELTKKEIDRHNSLLARAEVDAMVKHGRGILYLTKDKGNGYFASTWLASGLRVSCYNVRTSWHNIGRTRTDVDFMLEGSRWHGVNIGDSQILRVKRCKRL